MRRIGTVVLTAAAAVAALLTVVGRAELAVPGLGTASRHPIAAPRAAAGGAWQLLLAPSRAESSGEEGSPERFEAGRGFAASAPSAATVPAVEGFATGEHDEPFAGFQDPIQPSLAFELVRTTPRAPVVRVVGADRRAPRELLLWRLEGEAAAVMARGHSRPDGALVFPPLLVPGDGLTVVATSGDAGPDAWDASSPVVVSARVPEPPRARVRAEPGGGWILRVSPSEAVGRVLLATREGVVRLHRDLALRPGVADRVFEFRLVEAEWSGHVLLGQEFRDGRRSIWRAVTLQSPAGP